MPAHRLLIDTDPGIDDAMAIFYAGLHPEIEIVGMTGIFGNVTVERATANAAVLAGMLGRRIPVARGADRPLVQPPNPVSDYVHGPHGFGNLPPQPAPWPPEPVSAAEFICATVNAHPGEITLVPLGPLTNIALALRLDPSIAGKVRGVVLMGGGLERGNVTQFAEANIWNDPHAADEVLAADWPVTMVGLDVTSQVLAGPDYFAAVAAAAPRLGGFLERAARFYMRFYAARYGLEGAQMHDPTAIIAITDPALFDVETTALEVIVDGERAGQTLRAPGSGRRPVTVPVGVDADAVKERFLSVLATGH